MGNTQQSMKEYIEEAHNAIDGKDTSRLEELLKAGLSPDTVTFRDASGDVSLFLYACRLGYKDVVNTMLKYNPNPNPIPISDCEGPFQRAIINEWPDVIRKMMKLGANSNGYELSPGMADPRRKEIIFHAVSQNHIETVKAVFEESRIPINQDLKNRLLVEAANCGYVEMFTLLTDFGADISSRLKEVLISAVRSDNPKLVEKLKDEYRKLDEVDQSTILEMACKKSDEVYGHISRALNLDEM